MRIGRPARRAAGSAAPVRRGGGRLSVAVVLPLLVAGLVAAVTAGIAVGSVAVSPADTWGIMLHRVVPGWVEVSWPATHERIVLSSRLPRVLLGVVAGAGLALVGMVLQALVRNPLADPSLLGVSSGATLGAVLVVVSGVGLFGVYSLPLSAFLGALVALVTVYLLARTGGRTGSTRLVLSGVVVGQVFLSASSLLIMTSGDPHASTAVTRWTLGGLGGTTWQTLTLPSAVVVLLLAALAARTRSLNLLLAGEEAATTMGLAVGRFRTEMFLLTALVTGVIVAVSGVIGFVGLMMPHIARLLVGADHRRALPVATLLGAVFLVLADLASRTLASPEELPVGILTALSGAPFFLWLMHRESRGRRGRP
ncbi:FecCD family ABC transporter permease [Marinactinospora thermotolerans]|uniref:Iron complex transport system permease protein n=1 Tax=Marinactinospora thermotolerans DSM 45154 TaxID=1122192 RepID=A0A1T4R3R7_9ACTN|nr:iron ABC transporter permease [Marinactinospora thermotolerans]SKA10613.1 iron complex transport system permease protein [Marinactinospora thermotolerans DSM 45154]